MTPSLESPTDWFFEDFSRGQVFHTQGRTFTEADIVSFAGWSWDTNPVHIAKVHRLLSTTSRVR